MDLVEAENLALRLMSEQGLVGWSFGFNHRRRALGICNFTDRRIELSRHFVLRHEVSEVRETILHEIAHAIAGPKAGHGLAWKAACLRLGIAPRVRGEAEMPEGRWRAVCPGCGVCHSRYRRPMRGRDYYCKACGPERGKLRFRAGVEKDRVPVQ
ncbi:SprT family zinc-dependent metalloprotease [Mucisphaera calidilacus]|uniref:SprT-like family protein n=1 Tax=Mucisphaera calidilacus TaxID=2527982 RepID=A0A518BUY0_9BACT|nr:SprT-like domain-containing protein [Mucisphaera calidilacus]QDU70757.1 SprT-like family protein [Mucisphaera calidilacus]